VGSIENCFYDIPLFKGVKPHQAADDEHLSSIGRANLIPDSVKAG
jgi:hypothetical protein